MPLIPRAPAQVFDVPLDQYYVPPPAPVQLPPDPLMAPAPMQPDMGGGRSAIVDPAAYIPTDTPAPGAPAPAAKFNAPAPLDPTSPFQQFVASRNVDFSKWNDLPRPIQKQVLDDYHGSSTFKGLNKDPMVLAEARMQMASKYLTSKADDRGAFRQLGEGTYNAGAAAASGALNTVKSLFDAIPSKYAEGASKWLGELSKDAEGAQTKAKIEEKALLAYKLSNIPETDKAERFAVMSEYLLKNPAETLGTALGSMAPLLFPGGLAARAASVAGKTAAQAGTAFKAVNAATFGASGAGSVRGGAMDEIMKMPESELAKNAEYAKLRATLPADQARAKIAELVGSYAENGGQFAAGGVASAILSSLGGAEKALLGAVTKPGASAVKNLAGAGAGRTATTVGLKEGGLEVIEGGGQKVLANSAAGVDLTKGLGEDSASNLIMGAAGGATISGVSKLQSNRAAEKYLQNLPPEERAAAGLAALSDIKKAIGKKSEDDGSFVGSDVYEKTQNAQTWAQLQADNKNLTKTQRAILEKATPLLNIPPPTADPAAANTPDSEPIRATAQTAAAASAPVETPEMRTLRLRSAMDALMKDPTDPVARDALGLPAGVAADGQRQLFNDTFVNPAARPAAPADPVSPSRADPLTGQLFTDPSGQQPLFNDGVIKQDAPAAPADPAPTRDTATRQMFPESSGQFGLFSGEIPDATNLPLDAPIDKTQSLRDQIIALETKKQEVAAYGQELARRYGANPAAYNPLEGLIWERANNVLNEDLKSLQAYPNFDEISKEVLSAPNAPGQLFSGGLLPTTSGSLEAAVRKSKVDTRIQVAADILRRENNPAVAGRQIEDLLRGGPATQTATGDRFPESSDLPAQTASENIDNKPENFWPKTQDGQINRGIYAGAIKAGDLDAALRAFKAERPDLEILVNKLRLATPSGLTLRVAPVTVVGGVRAGAVYNPMYNRITIDPELAEDPYYLLHELVHAATARAMMADPSKLSPDVREAVARLDALYTEAVTSTQAIESQKNGAIYGLANRLEFAAEALSNKGFRDFLDTIPSKDPKTGFVTRFFDAMKRLLGFKEKSLAGQVIMALDTIMAGNSFAPFIEQKEHSQMLAAMRRDKQQITDYYEFRSYKDPNAKATATLAEDGTWTYQTAGKTLSGLSFEQMADASTKLGLYIRNKGVDTGARTTAAISREASITPGFHAFAREARKRGIGDSQILTANSFMRNTKRRYFSRLEGLQVADQLAGVKSMSGESMYDKFSALPSRIRSEISNQGFGRTSLYDAKKKAADLLKNSGINRDFFEDYYYARAAQVVSARLKPLGLYTSNGLPKTTFSGFTYVENGKSVDDDDGSKFLASPRVKQNEKTLQAIAEQMQVAEQMVTEQEYVSGRINMETYLDRKRQSFYAPLRNQKDDNPASLGSMRSREGRYTKADPPFSLHLKSLDDRMGRAMKTQMHNELADFISDNQSQMEGVFSLATVTLAPSSTITQHKDGSWINRGQAELENAGEIWAYNEGEARVISVVDPGLKEALTKYDGDPDASAQLFYAASQVTRVFTGTLTRWNPAFLAKAALMWDPVLAFANAQGAFGENVSDKDSGKFARSLVGNAIKLMSKVASSNTKGGVTDDPMLRLFNASGGGIDAVTRYDINKTRNKVGLKPDNLLNRTRGVLDKVQATLHSSDNAFRAAAFQTFLEHKNGGAFASEAALVKFAQENPKLVELAALGSKNILTNYEQKGTAEGFRSWIPFFNAAVQSSYATTPSILGSAHGRTTVYALMGLAGLAIMSGMGEKDEEGKDKMFRQKGLGSKIAFGGAALDVAPEFRPMVAMIQGFLGYATGNLTMGEASKLFIEKTMDNFTPFKVTGLEGGDGIWNRVAYILSGPFPLLAQLVAGKDYFGKETASRFPTDSDGNALKGAVPDALRGRPADAPWSKDVAKYIATSGGPDALPATYETAAKNVLGGFYSLARDFWKNAYNDPTGKSDDIGRGLVGALGKAASSSYDAQLIPSKYAEMKGKLQMQSLLDPTQPTEQAMSAKILDKFEQRLKDANLGGLTLKDAYKTLSAAESMGDKDRAAATRAQIQLLQNLHREIKAQALLQLEDIAR